MSPKTLSSLALLAFVSATCTDSQPSESVSQTWQEFRANPPVPWEEFRASVAKPTSLPESYIVDGDILLNSETELRLHYETWLAQEYRRTSPAQKELTVQHFLGADVLQPPNRRHALTYCVSDDFDWQKDRVVDEMKEATQSWSDRASVTFRHVDSEDYDCTRYNDNVYFSVEPTDDNNKFFAVAFFPNDYERSDRRILIAPSAFTTSSGGRDLQGILRHETGHVLGFRHEHISLGCTEEGTGESRLVTTYDVNSVMHYPQCRPSRGGGYRQSVLDEIGAASLYGAPRATECLFDWAEKTYPDALKGGGQTVVWETYVYRYYGDSEAYLSIDVTDQSIWYERSGEPAQRIGPKEDWLETAGCTPR